MKLCKIKHFSDFALDRTLTRANTALAFLRLWEPQPSICLCAWSCWVCRAEAGNAGVVASTELMFPRLPPRYVGSEEALLLLPLTSSFLECCFSCAACLWWRMTMQTFKSVCELLKRQKPPAWKYGRHMDWLVYSDVCTLFSVSKYLFWWLIFHYWEILTFSQIPRV